MSSQKHKKEKTYHSGQVSACNFSAIHTDAKTYGSDAQTRPRDATLKRKTHLFDNVWAIKIARDLGFGPNWEESWIDLHGQCVLTG